MSKILCVFLLTVFITACSPLTSNAFKKINVNDTQEEVERVLGKPFSKRAYYNKTFLVYYVYEDFFGIFINQKKVPFVGFPPLLRTGDEYWVILENGKVVAFGLSKNFGNSIPKALSDKDATLEVKKF